MYKKVYKSPVGELTIASDGESIIGLWMKGQKYFAQTVKEEMILKNDISIFDLAFTWLDEYFAGKNPDISRLTLAPGGGEFRQTVWKILCEIPYGMTTTYGDIAKKIATDKGKKKMSAQAVGGAVGHNPISIIIPCHRVIGSKGSLTGYAGGIEKKIKLLELEGVDITKLKISKKGTAL